MTKKVVPDGLAVAGRASSLSEAEASDPDVFEPGASTPDVPRPDVPRPDLSDRSQAGSAASPLAPDDIDTELTGERLERARSPGSNAVAQIAGAEPVAVSPMPAFDSDEPMPFVAPVVEAANLIAPQRLPSVPLATSALKAVGRRVMPEDGGGVMNYIGIDDHVGAGTALSDFASSVPMSHFVPSVADSAQAAGAAHDETDRLLHLYSPLPQDKRLLVVSIEGAAALSEPGRYALTLSSPNPSIDHKDVLSKNLTVAVRLAGGDEHPINGYVARFGYSHDEGDLAVYEADLVPWLWFLGHRVNSRVYQNSTPLDVLRKVFADYGAMADYEFRIFGSLPEEVFLMQYDESDLHFVSRIMERYGLFYYFEHRRDGHTLVVCDDSTQRQGCPEQTHHPVVRHRAAGSAREEDALTRLSSSRTLQPSTVALSTYSYKQPSTPPYIELTSVADQGDAPRLEVYDGNPAYAYRDRADGEREARQRLETFEWQGKQFFARTECRGMTVGRTFCIADHPLLRDDDATRRQFLVVGLRLSARNDDRGAQSQENGHGYRNELVLIRRDIPYRPVRRHAKPLMRGPQTATVVGPVGEELYIDELGRITVQFHWDREGRHDENSSCKLRVAQPLGGRDFGMVAWPRVGQEVIIDWLNGDCDRPYCSGRLYNVEQMPPYPLPDGAHVMGLKTRSTPGGGGFCEVAIHDKQGEELISIHSQKDLATTVQNAMATVVNGPMQTNMVSEGFQTNTVRKYIQLESLDEHIQATAKSDLALESREGLVSIKAKDNVQLQSSEANVVIEAKTNLTLRASGHTIVIGPEGILIDGKMVKISGPAGIYLNE